MGYHVFMFVALGRSPGILVVLASIMFASLLPGQTAVHVKSGRSFSAPAVASELDRDIDERRFPSMQKRLDGANLTPTERIYFRGVLADRTNHPQDAITDLQRILPALLSTDPHRAAVALRTLATDYFIVGRYAESVSAYAELLHKFGNELSEPAKRVCEDNLHTFELLKDAPPQTVSGIRTFTVPIKQDPIDDIEVPVQIGKSVEWWIFDTGANESAITASAAKRLGLKVSEGKATTQGASGAEVPLKTAIIPELKFGASVIHNVVALVMDDRSLSISIGKQGRYQIEGILGYPVLRALGSVTVLDSEINVAPESEPSPRSSSLYTEELTPLLQVSVEGHDLLLIFDTGAASTHFNARYVREFPTQFVAVEKTKSCMAGAGGEKCVDSYRLPRAELRLGDAHVTLHEVPSLRESMGTDQFDSVYGNAGGTLFNSLRAYTIDFRNMRFIAGEPLDK